jgi:hypothetical protein
VPPQTRSVLGTNLRRWRPAYEMAGSLGAAPSESGFGDLIVRWYTAYKSGASPDTCNPPA